MWFRMGCMHWNVIPVVWEDWIPINIQYRWFLSLPVVYRSCWSITFVNISACCDHMVLWLSDSVFAHWLLWYTIPIITCTGKTTALLVSKVFYIPWWRHRIETFSAILVICAGKSIVAGEFPANRPVTWSFDILFDLRLNKRLSKQSGGWWFELPSHPLWRHCNA